MKIPRSFLLPVGLLGLAVVSQAPAQTVITSAPYTIATSGRYVLGDNLASSDVNQPAITISAPNVVLDLKGHYVTGPGNPTVDYEYKHSTIYVGQVANVTIKNGTVSGNAYGIYFAATSAGAGRNELVDSIVATRCYLYGIYFDSAYNGAPSSRVRNCVVTNIGGSTSAANVNAVGINTTGSVRVENNTVSGLTSTGDGSTFGIATANPSYALADFAIGNTISGCAYGVYGHSINLNNLTYGCTTAFVSGTNATGNN